MNFKNNYIVHNIKQMYIELHTFQNFRQQFNDIQDNLHILNNLFNSFVLNNFSIHQSNINCGPIEEIPILFHNNGFLPYCCCYEYQIINENLINLLYHEQNITKNINKNHTDLFHLS
eukprot:536564_1